MQILINLFSIVLWIQLLQLCRGDSSNWTRIDDNNEIYPWLVQIKQKIRPGQHSKVAYGTLISDNAVITTQESIVGNDPRELIVESYCSKPNDKIMNDCFTSNVSTIISETLSESLQKNQDPFAILILKNSFNGNYVRPLSIVDQNNIDKNNCFFPTWPSDDPSENSMSIDLRKTTHKVKMYDGNYLADELNKNVIYAVSKEFYLNLLRFYSLYSDVYVPKMNGVPLVCSLKNNSNQVTLIGPMPAYLLKSCNREKQNCRSIVYYIDLISYLDDVKKKLN